jgi:hypothetical protein
VVAEKPRRASDYKSEQTELVRATCLYVATRLGSLLDKVVFLGGATTSLLITDPAAPEIRGTLD